MTFLPIGNTWWRETLGVSGSVQIAEQEDPTATPIPPTQGCTRSKGFWKNHPQMWGTDQLPIGSQMFLQPALLDILKMHGNHSGDATIILAQQLIAAKLNVVAGASITAIGDALAQADALLKNYPVGSNPPSPDRNALIAVSMTLEAFNKGQMGPSHCADDDEEDEDDSGEKGKLTPIPMKPEMPPEKPGDPAPAVEATAPPVPPPIATPIPPAPPPPPALPPPPPGEEPTPAPL